MTAPEPAHGWLIITAINTVNGGADSSTFAVTGTQRGEGVERMFVTDGETGKKAMITTSEPGAVPLEVEPYRELIRQLIAADATCPGCRDKSTTMVAHLLSRCDPELVADLWTENP